ncbi:hypothetical protein HHI36_020800 [Cryptolaemus montrouzieri]|uniref:Uncharacterized protein n=1 Tax=Cryptolaemus montrouzieri TaxID=559131 RepID=A0ABD2NCF9_9CUCU
MILISGTFKMNFLKFDSEHPEEFIQVNEKYMEDFDNEAGKNWNQDFIKYENDIKVQIANSENEKIIPKIEVEPSEENSMNKHDLITENEVLILKIRKELSEEQNECIKMNLLMMN